MNNTLLSLILTCISGLSTMLGTLLIFYKGNISKVLNFSLSLAIGVMLAVSIFDLIPTSYLSLYEIYGGYTTLLIIVLIIIGIFISSSIDIIFSDKREGEDTLYRLGIFAMLAMIIHNIPEGIITYLSSSNNIKLGINMAMAIAIHNIPEGISIAVPIYISTKNKFKAIFYTSVAALSELIGAIITIIFSKNIMLTRYIDYMLVVVAGLMIHISLFKLLPEVMKYKRKQASLIYIIVGVFIMLLSIIIIN